LAIFTPFFLNYAIKALLIPFLSFHSSDFDLLCFIKFYRIDIL
jgi:hypothetical protein